MSAVDFTSSDQRYLLDALTATAAREHELTYKAGLELLEHAILCGEALLEMKELVEPRTWTPTLKSLEPKLGFSITTGFHYMRIALHRDEVFDAGIETVTGAIEMLRSEDRRVPPGYKSQLLARLDIKHTMADELFATTDYSLSQIGEMVGVSENVLRRWITPDTVSRAVIKKQKKQAGAPAGGAITRELERMISAQKTAQKAGVSEAYSLMRKLAQSLDGLYRDGANVEIRAAAGNALKHVHKAEDAFINALRNSGNAS